MEAFVGTILPVAFTYPPPGWLLCTGQIVSIQQHQLLFAVVGFRYGGDGQSTFGIPNLQGRVPINQGQLAGGGIYTIGSTGGVETVTLNTQQMPLHTHAMTVDGSPGKTSVPAGNYFAQTQAQGADDPFNSFTPNPARPAILNQASLQAVGGNLPHENRQPYLVINYIICTDGLYPSRQ